MTTSRICVAVALQRYLDITPVAERVRELATALSSRYGAPLAVVSVEAPVELLPEVETLEEKLERFVAPLRGQGLEVRAELRRGRPSQHIRAFVEEVGADLLVIGTHSKRSVVDIGIGSTAAALMREVAISMVMVRPTVEEQARAKELMIPRYPLVFPYG